MKSSTMPYDSNLDNYDALQRRIGEVKKLVDDACVSVTKATAKRRTKIAPHRILRRLEKQLKRPLTEYLAGGRQDSIKEARNIIRKTVEKTRGKR